MSASVVVKVLKYYEAEIAATKKELSGLPVGILIKRGVNFCVRVGSIEKGISKDQQRIRLLTRKEYLSKRLSNLEWNYSLLNRQSQRIRTEDPEDIIAGLSPVYRSLPVHYFFQPSIQQLQESPGPESARREDGLIYYTDSGIRVRSKSERTIADLLDRHRIPYRYEAALSLGARDIHPDFSISRPSDGKLVIWEHCGLLDQEDYRQNLVRKLALYTQNGFLPLKNLICTYEHDLRDPTYLGALIETVLLR